MASKTRNRNWYDVETAIATVAIVGTLGLWNLFASPVQKPKPQPAQPLPPTEEPPVAVTPTPMPYVKITFATQLPPQPAAPAQPAQVVKKQKHKNNNGGGGGATVTTTTTS
jgi:hypothetical protein